MRVVVHLKKGCQKEMDDEGHNYLNRFSRQKDHDSGYTFFLILKWFTKSYRNSSFTALLSPTVSVVGVSLIKQTAR